MPEEQNRHLIGFMTKRETEVGHRLLGGTQSVNKHLHEDSKQRRLEEMK